MKLTPGNYFSYVAKLRGTASAIRKKYFSLGIILPWLNEDYIIEDDAHLFFLLFNLLCNDPYFTSFSLSIVSINKTG